MAGWIIVNSVAIISWIILAIHFEKWWIALFALLFTYSYKGANKEHNNNDGDDSQGKPRTKIKENNNGA